MKKKTAVRKVKPLKTEEQWHLHRNVAHFALNLDREASSADIRKNKLRSAPAAMLDMVF